MALMMQGKIIAIIPARGGSKGLPRKNTKLLAGKPLLAWTIDACIRCKNVGKIIVSSDDPEALSIARELGVEALLRPAHLALDETLSVPVITHALNSMGDSFAGYEYVGLFQPTSPVRDETHINGAFCAMLESGASAVISVTSSNNSFLKDYFLRGGYLSGVVNNEFPFLRRQDLPDTFSANGAIYMVKLAQFLRYQSLLSDQTIPFLMDDVSSLDIDNMSDFERAEAAILADTRKEN